MVVAICITNAKQVHNYLAIYTNQIWLCHFFRDSIMCNIKRLKLKKTTFFNESKTLLIVVSSDLSGCNTLLLSIG